MITVSFLPILIAGVVAVFVGWLWYSQYLFGNAYTRLSGATPEMVERGKKRMPLNIFVSLLAYMLIAWVMTFVGIALNEFIDWISAIELGFWIWIGFVAPVMLGMVVWEQKPFQLYLIQVSHWLVTLIAIALVLLFGGQYVSGVASPYDPGEGTIEMME
ncbi:MAG: DUF1761 domain-containing protein [bacterium]|nr:DUF1761 domain-containing protein [bacterium]